MPGSMKGIDELYTLFKKKKRINLREAAKVLKVPSSTALRWARALEEDGILDIEFEGKEIMLNWVSMSAPKKTKDSSGDGEEEVSKRLEYEFEKITKEYEKKISQIREKSTELRELEKERSDIVSRNYTPLERKFEAELQLLNDQLNSKEAEVAEMEQLVSSVPKRLETVAEKARKMAEIESFAKNSVAKARSRVKGELKKINDTQSLIESYLKEIHERVEEQNERLRGIEKELLRLKKIEDWMIVQQEELESKLDVISKDRVESLKRYSDLKESFSTGYSKKYLGQLASLRDKYARELKSIKKKEAELELGINKTKKELTKLNIESKLIVNRFEKLSGAVKKAKGKKAKSKVIKEMEDERKRFERSLKQLSSQDLE